MTCLSQPNGLASRRDITLSERTSVAPRRNAPAPTSFSEVHNKMFESLNNRPTKSSMSLACSRTCSVVVIARSVRMQRVVPSRSRCLPRRSLRPDPRPLPNRLRPNRRASLVSRLTLTAAEYGSILLGTRVLRYSRKRSM